MVGEIHEAAADRQEDNEITISRASGPELPDEHQGQSDAGVGVQDVAVPEEDRVRQAEGEQRDQASQVHPGERRLPAAARSIWIAKPTPKRNAKTARKFPTMKKFSINITALSSGCAG